MTKAHLSKDRVAKLPV